MKGCVFMKKSISFFVCLAMLISFASPCFANKNQTSAEKVLEAIKPRIGETNHFENFETSYTETDNGKKIYTFFILYRTKRIRIENIFIYIIIIV